MSEDFEGRLDFAHRLADAAGAVIRPYFRQRLDVTEKKIATHAGDFDPVTEADRGAEKALRVMIEETYPDDAILGEEFGEKDGTSAYRWVLDPVDGTRAFIAGIPMWGTLIALERNGKSVLGIIDQPFLRERFIGAGTRAEFRNADGTSSLSVRSCGALSDAVITTTHPTKHFLSEEHELFTSVESKARLSRYGGDCYAYGLLAMGFVDLVMEAHLRVWDFAALVPVIESAGGVVTDWEGNAPTDHGTILAAGDARVHAEALAVIAAARGEKT
jgi:histidinol phosphatase-like enzyme (inositol monophosphatase family)